MKQLDCQTWETSPDYPFLCAYVLDLFQVELGFDYGVLIQHKKKQSYVRAEYSALESDKSESKYVFIDHDLLSWMSLVELHACWENKDPTQLNEQLCWIPLNCININAGILYPGVYKAAPNIEILRASCALILYQAKEYESLETQFHERTESLSEALDDLRTTQAQLVDSEKMASLGNLVAGIAHELNTPIGISVTASSSLANEIVQFAQKYESGLVGPADLENFVENLYEGSQLILKNNQRAGELVQSFKQVSVDQSIDQKRSFPLKSYLDDVVYSLRPTWEKKEIQVKVLADDTLQVLSYPGVFAQIISNLIMNSVLHGFKSLQAGDIVIDIKKQKKADNPSAIHALISFLDQQDTPENPAVDSDGDSEYELVMSYSDNGCGMTDHVLERIFDPFFTTNKQTGIGLGMHIVYNLVTQKLGGEIHCESQLEQGVAFRIVLPYNCSSDGLKGYSE